MYSRKQLAQNVLDTLRRGPASLHDAKGCSAEDYRLWMQSWLEAQLVVLVPELAKDPVNAGLFNDARELLNNQHRPKRAEPTVTEDMQRVLNTVQRTEQGACTESVVIALHGKRAVYLLQALCYARKLSCSRRGDEMVYVVTPEAK